MPIEEVQPDSSIELEYEGEMDAQKEIDEWQSKAALWDNWVAALEQDCPVCGKPFDSYERGYIEPVHNYCQTVIDALVHPSQEEMREGEERNSKAALWDAREDPTPAEEIAELRRKAALWDDAGWMALVDLVSARINQATGCHADWGERRYLARAFVRVARELKLPLKVAVAIAEWETRERPFSNDLVGGAGERTLMQINPLTDARKQAIEEGLKDPAKAIDWALRNCFMPGYRANIEAGTTQKWAIRSGLKRYNGSAAYADKVLALMEKEYTDSLWQEVPE